MSQAFVRERDDDRLQDVKPALNDLKVFLTRQNNGVPVYELEQVYSKKHRRTVHKMSDGYTYALDIDNRWEVVEEN